MTEVKCGILTWNRSHGCTSTKIRGTHRKGVTAPMIRVTHNIRSGRAGLLASKAGRLFSPNPARWAAFSSLRQRMDG
jgi:hypothetical protein